MAFSTGARHGLSYVPEVTFGTTPSTPTMKDVRMTGTTVGPRRDQIISQELDGSRQIIDVRPGNKQLQGNIAFEFGYGSFDDLLESAAWGSWSANVLKAGVAQKAFTFERRFLDIASYWRLYGSLLNIWTLRFQPNAFVTGTFEVVGKGVAVGSTSLDASPDDVTDNLPFDTYTGSLLVDGVAFAQISTMDIRLDNGITPTFVLFNQEAPQFVPRKSNMNGTLTSYVVDNAQMTKFLAGTPSDLAITMLDPDGNSLLMEIPSIIYTGADTPTSDDGAIMQTLPFQAKMDAALGAQFSLTRTPAV